MITLQSVQVHTGLTQYDAERFGRLIFAKIIKMWDQEGKAYFLLIFRR